MKSPFGRNLARPAWTTLLWFVICTGGPAVGHAALHWESNCLQFRAGPGETHVAFVFRFTNQTSDEVVIHQVTPSCGCTMVKLPSMPWTVPPGTGGVIEGKIDVHGKHGLLQKTITLQTSQGAERLECQISVSEVLGERREQNIKLAQVDRQAVFKGDCASCHVGRAQGKTGLALYTAACAICHEGEHRASMVPDLAATAAGRVTEPAYLEKWLREGKEGTLMPAFAKAAGGPLDDAQIQSLVRGLVARAFFLKP